ncbi:MAG: 16S rRNA (guanine(527)-N(7))-methyltransferase RsmG [Alphaproteobacteria bacterium]|nr:16S rRNA (guanine(527)-N(7))-methyltransferase RsmG [Alphaproteobacteria bacterium]
MTSAGFTALIDVSRETSARLETYLALLMRWQRAINLVGPATLADPWRRHILDSAQLLRHLPREADAIYDLGSGAGLPGLVLAIMGRTDIHLVESDQRKVQFLQEVVRTLDLRVEVHAERIEKLPAGCAGVVTARALAPLPRLLALAAPLLRADTLCLFLKGRSASDELTEARKCWRMSAESFPSLSDPSASVLKLWDIASAPLHRQ